MRTAKKDWVTCMTMIEYLFKFGYTVYMSNHKRWGVMMNDNNFYFISSDDNLLPELNEDFRGNKFTPNQSNLEDCCDLLDFILEQLIEVENKSFIYTFDGKPYEFTLNQFTENNELENQITKIQG